MNYSTVLLITICFGVYLGTYASFFDPKRREEPRFTLTQNYVYSFIIFFVLFNVFYLIGYFFK